MNNKYTPQDWQLISAYLDGQLNPKEKTRLEARLQTEVDLQQAYLDMRQTRLLLKSAKNVKAPRNFTISEAQASSIKPVRSFRFLPMLSISSVLATIMLIFVIFLDVSIRPGITSSVAMEPAAESLSMQAAPQMDSSREVNNQENPLIIQWGNGASGLGGSGGGGDATSLAIGGGAPEYSAKSGSELPGMGGVDPGATNTAPLPETPSEPALSASAVQESEPIVGAGPILGIRTEEEAKTYNQAVMEILKEQSNANKSSNIPSMPILRLIQASLALVALATGGTALFLWRKSKV
ncbi:MAG: hypothetical protein HGB14_01740 [Anaerolineaceae bacterium]|nr:hypothetical protein [Anaerolineaceae bacterium]